MSLALSLSFRTWRVRFRSFWPLLGFPLGLSGAVINSSWNTVGFPVITNWNTTAPWSPSIVPNNTGSDSFNVTIDGGISGGASVFLDLDATIDALFLGTNDQLTFNNHQSLTIVGPAAGSLLVNNGAILLSSIGNFTDLTLAAGSIGGTGTLTIGNNASNRLLSSGGVITQLNGHTIRGAGIFLGNTGGFINQGSLVADQTNTLFLDPDANGFVNQGELKALGSGGMVFYPGAYTNAGHLIEVGTGSRLDLQGGVRVLGGRLETTGTGLVRALNGAVTFDGVTLDPGSNLQVINNTDLVVRNSLRNDGTISVLSIGNLTDLSFEGAQSLDGAGTVVLSNNLNNRLLTDNTVLTHGIDHTLRGAGQLLANTGGMINRGTILAEGTNALIIDPNALGFENIGTLEAVGSGGLDLRAGSYTNGLAPILVGTGSKLLLNNDTEIIGGTLQTVGTGHITLANGTAGLESVTLDGVLNVTNNTALTLRNAHTNHGTIQLNSIGNLTDLSFEGGQTLSGTGSVVLSNNLNNRLLTDNTVLTLGADQTLRGAGQLLANTGGMINRGTILQQGTNALVIDPNGLGFSNESTLQAQGAGGIVLQTGVYTNTGQVMDVVTGSKLELNAGVEILGGTLQTSGTGLIRVIGGPPLAPVLDSVTLAGLLRVDNNRQVAIVDGIVNAGTIELNSIGNVTELVLSGTPSLDGDGTIVMSNNLSNRISGADGENHLLTHAASHTIRGAGQLLLNRSGMNNAGTILAEGTNKLVIDPNGLGFTNTGTLRAVGAGGLRFEAGSYTLDGTVLEIADGSRLELVNGAVVSGGTLRATGGGQTGLVLVANSTPVLEGVTLDAPLQLNNNLGLLLRDGLVNQATISMNSIGNQTNLIFEAAALPGSSEIPVGTLGAVLSGNGSVLMSNNLNNRIYVEGGLLVNGPGQTLRGAGQLMANLGGLHNQGTILAEGTNKLVLDPNGLGFTNTGTLRAVGSGGITFETGVHELSGTTVTIAGGSQLTLAGGARLRNGTLQELAVAQILLSGGTPILEAMTVDSALRISNNQSLQVEGGLTNDGSIALNSIGNATDLDFVGAQTLGGTGEVVMSNNANNRILANGAVLTHGAGHTLRGSGTLLSNLGGMLNEGAILADQSAPLTIDPDALGFSNTGTLTASGVGRIVFAAGDATNAAGGILRGDHRIDVSAANFLNDGLIQPGIDGPGALEIVGDLPFGANAVLQIELGGTGQGSDYDWLQLSGSGDVSLDGQLALSLVDGFVPAITDTFTILSTSGLVSGLFDNTGGNVLHFPAGSFAVDYELDRVVLHRFVAIPEPRALGLILGLVALLAAVRRVRG